MGTTRYTTAILFWAFSIIAYADDVTITRIQERPVNMTREIVSISEEQRKESQKEAEELKREAHENLRQRGVDYDEYDLIKEVARIMTKRRDQKLMEMVKKDRALKAQQGAEDNEYQYKWSKPAK